ncbi:MFS transporter [Tepidicaulis sp. LMO-SS28]|uniref:MFS transporter n=1 Tax=Tepidicaulis sp. LMO-SS28 TaxID=3447455 RepID=UPI003EE12DFC
MGFSRNFWFLFLAFFTSSIGDWIFRLSVPIIIYQVTESPLAMAAAYACSFAPIFLIMPFGGVVADNYDRRRILIIGDLCAAFVCCALAIVVFYLDESNYLALYPLVFALACVTAIYHPTFQSIIPQFVSNERLPHANSLIFTAENLINVLGPLSGGLVVALLGHVGAIVANGATYITSLVLVLFIGATTRYGTSGKFTITDALQRLQDGFQVAMSIPLIRYGTVIFFFANFATHLVVGNFVYFLAHDIGLRATDIGLTIALTGLGGIAGAVAAPFLIRRIPSGPLMLAAVMIGGVIVLGLLTTSSMWSVAFVRGLSMALESIVVVTMFTLRQRLVSSEFLGRTVAITRALSFSSIPIAAAIGGWMIELNGNMNAVIWASGIVLMACALWAYTTPFPRQELEAQKG